MSFFLSKALWYFVNPTHILFAAVVLGFWRYAATHKGIWAALTGLALTVIVLVGVLPVGLWLIAPLEERFPRPAAPPAEVTGIIVLGGAQEPNITAARDVLAVNSYAERLIEGLALARRYPRARLVFSGGSGRVFARENGEVVVNEKLLELLPVAGDRTIMEMQSRNTFENAVESKALVDPGPDETWLLVTSAYHMPRSVGVFRAAGWEVVPWPVDYQAPRGLEWQFGFDIAGGLAQLNDSTRELIGLAAYRLLGRTDTLFPGPDDAGGRSG